MSSPSVPEPPSAYDPRDPDQAARFALIVSQSTHSDGRPPFSDQSLIDLETGAREGIIIRIGGEVSGVALLTSAGDPREAELVIAPTARRRGLGGRLLEHLLRRAGMRLLVWAHGDHPDARALADGHGLEPVRELLQLRLAPVHARGTQADVTCFRPGIDDAAWLELNARAFAKHPEQGALTQRDLDARIGEHWFDPDDFLISRDESGRMTGFCWLKAEDHGDGERIGEFYAVGVAPEAQGTGLGRRLVNAGLARLDREGIREARLYVEADNLPAAGLYRSVGFTDHSIDVLYASRPTARRFE